MLEHLHSQPHLDYLDYSSNELSNTFLSNNFLFATTRAYLQALQWKDSFTRTDKTAK